MKKLVLWILTLCIFLSMTAMAEVGETLIVNEDLLAFENELTGEVVRIGMTIQEVEAITGQGNVVRGVPLLGRTIVYEGGIAVSYRTIDDTMVAMGMTVIPTLIDGENIFDVVKQENISVERAYAPDDWDAVQNSTGIVLKQAEMDRTEIEAITGPALREYYILDEVPFILNQEVEYMQAGWIDFDNNYKTMQSAAGEPGSLLMVDYEGISVLYSIQEDGEVRAGMFNSGCWYRMANGFDMGDDADEIQALLGEYAKRADEGYIKEHDEDYLIAYLYRGEDGLRLVTEEERDQLVEDNGNWKNIYYLRFRVGEYFGGVTYVMVSEML